MKTGKFPAPEEETVAKFVWVAENDTEYVFAAVFAAERWHITGEAKAFEGERVFTHSKFRELIRRDDIIYFAIATNWRTPKGDDK